MLSTELRILIRDTGRVWWRLLAVILGVYLMGGIRVFQTFRLWLRDRAVSYAVAHRGPGRSRSLLCHLQNRPAGDPVESLGIVLRAALAGAHRCRGPAAVLVSRCRAGVRFQDPVLAEVWHKGQPYAARVPGATAFARYRDKRAFRRVGPPPKGIRLAAARIQEAFFGDIDDKYLPAVVC